MESSKHPHTLRSTLRSKEAPAASSSYSLQSEFEAQTARLQDIHKAQRPKNTTRSYEPKQKEWENWCARLKGNTDGARVTEDKLCLFLEQQVVNRESRAAGYQNRKAKRKEMWKDGERAKRQKTAEWAGEQLGGKAAAGAAAGAAAATGSVESLPETDIWLKRMETYHPDRADNEVVRLDLAGSGFLRLLRALRVILLQDSVVLRELLPLHPLWKDPLFGCEEYQRFAARVKSSLKNVVMPDELIMQQFWPAHEAVAKLRHEAAISEIKGVQLDVQTILERLNEMERSSASFAPAPIWIQQGKTGIWIGPTVEPDS